MIEVAQVLMAFREAQREVLIDATEVCAKPDLCHPDQSSMPTRLGNRSSERLDGRLLHGPDPLHPLRQALAESRDL